ncbi:MAG: uridine kinase [Candidatus Avigastranaerophilus sp.]
MTGTLIRNIESETDYAGKYVSSPTVQSRSIEARLSMIFENEINSEAGVLLDYNPKVIRKLAMFIAGDIRRSASVGIAGETASGKSTITLDIIDTIEKFAAGYNLKHIITRVNTDDYYYDRSQEVKKAGGMAEFAKNYDFDVPEALELDLMCRHINELLCGNSVMLPKYDMSGTTIRWDNHTLANPSRIIISEGLFTLTDKIKDVFDFKIYVDIDRDIQKKRFFIRAHERGLGASSQTMYDNASNKAEIYIRPCRKDADIVLTGEADREGYRKFLNKIISVIERVYF